MQLHPDYPIETPRLRLRPLRPEDTPDLLAYRGDAEVCRFLPFEPMDEAVLAQRLAGDFARTALTGEAQALTLGVESAESGSLIGDVVLFFHSAEHRAGEIGYVFHPEATGRGHASEACSALLNLAFGELGLHRVIARINGGNHASAKLAERLGMRHEASHLSSLRFKGAWADLEIYAILAEEWRLRRS
ncbi:MAG: GNAT family N-acetyltransferase [Renibacterium salmoninarum]|nr:GNAT family N-acetyltransferase [Renibacterium salmoninarum]